MKVLKAKEAAAYLQISKPFLDRMRISGDGPVYLKIGRAVRYRTADLDAWLATRLTRSTSQAAIRTFTVGAA